MGFAKAGVKFPCVEYFCTFSRKKPFRFFIFCKFEKRKWFLLRFVFIESFGFLSPAFAKPFPVVRHAAKIAHKVCENRKIYLKFLNKPNFNVPKNWGKIFGKTA